MAAEAGHALEVVSGRQPGRRFELGDGAFEIGREAGKDGRLGDDPQLSRRHARISVEAGGRLAVQDLGSTNGTFVNGDQISESTLLRAGDTVAVGDTTLRVVTASSAERGSRPGPVHGGVHTVPTDLLKVLAARAPVKREWVVKAGLTAFAIIVAVNFTLRTIAVEYLDVRSDLPTMRPYVLLLISLMPTLADSIGFWKSFGRPADHSLAHYIGPAIGATLFFAILELILLPSDANTAEYLVTALVPVVPPSIILPAMLGLRVRAELTAEAELAGARAVEQR